MRNWSLSGNWLDVTSHQISVSLRGGPRGADVAISRNAVRCAKKHQSIEQFGDIQWTLVQKLLIDRTRRFPRALCALGMTCLKVRLNRTINCNLNLKTDSIFSHLYHTRFFRICNRKVKPAVNRTAGSVALEPAVKDVLIYVCA